MVDMTTFKLGAAMLRESDSTTFQIRQSEDRVEVRPVTVEARLSLN
jgi:hypothetical protein